MKLLVHICCAPCSVACIKELRSEGIGDLCGLWYNPNIHPFTEYKARRLTLIDYAKSIDLPLLDEGEYGLRYFISNIYPDYDNRCGFCYSSRLEYTAKRAKELKMDAFTTTLLISPYQKHDLIKETGERIAEEIGIPFLYRDFRPYFRQGQDEARELGLYMQKYCGCVFSEEERYRKKKKQPQLESR